MKIYLAGGYGCYQHTTLGTVMSWLFGGLMALGFLFYIGIRVYCRIRDGKW